MPKDKEVLAKTPKVFTPKFKRPSFILGTCPKPSVKIPTYEEKLKSLISAMIDYLKIPKEKIDSLFKLTPKTFLKKIRSESEFPQLNRRHAMLIESLYISLGHDALLNRLRKWFKVKIEFRPYNRNQYDEPWGSLVLLNEDNQFNHHYHEASWDGTPGAGGIMTINARGKDIVAGGHLSLHNRANSVRCYMITNSKGELSSLSPGKAIEQLKNNKELSQIFR